MNLIVWNYEGLGGARAIRETANMFTKYKPILIFLIKTKRKKGEMDWLRSRWKFEHFFTVEGVGRAGGLAILWMKEVKVEIVSFSRYHIDVRMRDCGDTNQWRFTRFYGDLETNRRQHSWDMLQTLKN